MVQVKYIKEYIDAVRAHPIIAGLLAITGLLKLSDEILTVFSNPVLRDATTIVFCGFAVGTTLTVVYKAMREPFKFAKDKLPSHSAIFYALGEKTSTAIVALLIVAGMSVYAWSSVAAVFSHASPPWQAGEVCFRVPQQCRSCVAFLDQKGRVIPPACLRFADDAGLIQLPPERWTKYLPHSVRLSCGTTTTHLKIQTIREGKKCASLSLPR